jgi:hypothetical protein
MHKFDSKMVAKGNNNVDYGFSSCGVPSITGMPAIVHWYKIVMKNQNTYKKG